MCGRIGCQWLVFGELTLLYAHNGTVAFHINRFFQAIFLSFLLFLNKSASITALHALLASLIADALICENMGWLATSPPV
ncbi:hypothetical protein BC940DRAFT_289407 [Gongronella butleri]|nr:hypothetical protein BC940DRAFT_289407 [Gongronella butleri]